VLFVLTIGMLVPACRLQNLKFSFCLRISAADWWIFIYFPPWVFSLPWFSYVNYFFIFFCKLLQSFYGNNYNWEITSSYTLYMYIYLFHNVIININRIWKLIKLDLSLWSTKVQSSPHNLHQLLKNVHWALYSIPQETQFTPALVNLVCLIQRWR
jgi:hypothetical protein